MVTTYSDKFLENANVATLVEALRTVHTESIFAPSEEEATQLDRVSSVLCGLSPMLKEKGYEYLSDKTRGSTTKTNPEKAQDYENCRTYFRWKIGP